MSMLDEWPMRLTKIGVQCTRNRCWDVIMIGQSVSLRSIRYALVRHIEDKHVKLNESEK